jgi:hypothetical protein
MSLLSAGPSRAKFGEAEMYSISRLVAWPFAKYPKAPPLKPSRLEIFYNQIKQKQRKQNKQAK